MMTIQDGMLLGMVGVALGVAFLLSGMEAGLFALSRFRIRRLARQGDRRAARLHHYLEYPESFLWTILVGNTLAALVVVAVAVNRLEGWLGLRPTAFMASLVFLLFLVFVFADLLPKVLFRRFPNRLCLAGVVPFRMIHVALSPVVGLTEWISARLLRLTGGQAFRGRVLRSRAELRHAIEEAGLVLSREELVMINRILDLQNRRVRDVMTPMDRAASLEADGRVADLLSLVRQRQISYVPVWKGVGRARRVHGVVGISGVLFDATLEPEHTLEGLIQPAVFVDETMRLEDALQMMQRGRQRLAVVLNAQKSEIGVVTLNDILRAMFGEVRV